MLRFAWRNIWRNKRRSFLTITAISFVAAILVFFMCLQLSTYNTAIEATTSLFHSHIHIEQEGYYERPQMRLVVNNADELLEKLRSLPVVVAATKRSFGFALVSSDSRSYGVQIVGVDLSRESEISSIPGRVEQGEYLSNDNEYSAVLGKTLATNLKVTVGDELTILGQGKDGSLAATVLAVKGIFYSGSPDIDRAFIQIPIQVFDTEFRMYGAVHQVAVRTDNLDQLKVVQRTIEDLTRQVEEDLEVLRWDEFLPGLKDSMDLDFATSWLFYFSLILVVCFTIVNTILMSVLERTREFGIMLALGATPYRICRMVATESILLTFLGLMGGICLGACVTTYFGYQGFYIPGTEEIMSQWNLSGKLYPKLSVAALTYGPLVILSMALIGLVYPLLKINRMEAIEAMGMH